MIQLATRSYASEYKNSLGSIGKNVCVGIYGHSTMKFIFDTHTKKVENMPCSGITTPGMFKKYMYTALEDMVQ